MPKGVVNEYATAESRAKGGRASHASQARKKEERQEKADETLFGHLDAAIARLGEALDATTSVFNDDGEVVGDRPDYANRLRASSAILDRLLGKPSQRVEHEGRVTHDVAYARSRLAARLTEQARNSAAEGDPR